MAQRFGARPAHRYLCLPTDDNTKGPETVRFAMAIIRLSLQLPEINGSVIGYLAEVFPVRGDLNRARIRELGDCN